MFVERDVISEIHSSLHSKKVIFIINHSLSKQAVRQSVCLSGRYTDRHTGSLQSNNLNDMVCHVLADHLIEFVFIVGVGLPTRRL